MLLKKEYYYQESVKRERTNCIKKCKANSHRCIFSIFDKSSKDGMASGLDLESLITLSEDVEVSGRVSGDLSSDSRIFLIPDFRRK